MTRPDVDEMKLEPIDPGLELWPSSKLSLATSPVVPAAPIFNETAQCGEWNTLIPTGASLTLGPASLL
jgi:hypothetical protein